MKQPINKPVIVLVDEPVSTVTVEKKKVPFKFARFVPYIFRRRSGKGGVYDLGWLASGATREFTPLTTSEIDNDPIELYLNAPLLEDPGNWTNTYHKIGLEHRITVQFNEGARQRVGELIKAPTPITSLNIHGDANLEQQAFYELPRIGAALIPNLSFVNNSECKVTTVPSYAAPEAELNLGGAKEPTIFINPAIFFFSAMDEGISVVTNDTGVQNDIPCPFPTFRWIQAGVGGCGNPLGGVTVLRWRRTVSGYTTTVILLGRYRVWKRTELFLNSNPTVGDPYVRTVAALRAQSLAEILLWTYNATQTEGGFEDPPSDLGPGGIPYTIMCFPAEGFDFGDPNSFSHIYTPIAHGDAFAYYESSYTNIFGVVHIGTLLAAVTRGDEWYFLWQRPPGGGGET